MAEALGCYAEYVEEPEDIRPALQRAWKKVEEGMFGFVNVKTDYRARAKVRGPPPGRSLTRRRAEMPTVVGSNKSRSAQEPTAMRPRSGMP